MHRTLKTYLRYCNTPAEEDYVMDVLVKGFARILPTLLLIILFMAGHIFANVLTIVALILGIIFLVYLVGLI